MVGVIELSLTRRPAVCCCVLQELSAATCYKILSQISDEDCRALGFDTRYTRPDWMLVSVLPVPPPPVRPSVMMDSSAR
jgi:DNA-directed RNA polymerase II subunit RPB1